MTSKWRKMGAVLLLGFCILAALFSCIDPVDDDPPSPELRRHLKAKRGSRNQQRRAAASQAMHTTTSEYQEAESHLQPLIETPEPENDYLEETASRTFVVTTTYYPDISDLRFQIAVDMCSLAKLYKIHLIIVDDSPEHETVREAFQQAGTAEYVKVHRQDKTQYSGKGGALKQAIQHAASFIQESIKQKGNVLHDSVICFTEPEKLDLMNHMHQIVKPILDGKSDVVVPTRSDELFKRTYPIEQYHSESFGNMHFDLLAKEFEGFQKDGARKLDWLFGPFAFKASLARGWLGYEGTSWDAQIIPYVRGVRQHNWRIMSVTVPFRHPQEMKEQEEGYPAWTKKRLKQLTLLFDLLGDKELS
ncbi:hypothetical protein ACHAXR_009697 [Thalassiosira sp. AJA248-18]